jgi:hypothetical protein
VPEQEMLGEKSLFTGCSQVIHRLIRVTLAKRCSRASGFVQKITGGICGSTAQLLVARAFFANFNAMRIPFFCFCLALAVSASGAQIKINFGDFPEGSAPTNDFHGALAGYGKPGDWKIVMDEVPPLLAPLTDRAPVTTRRAVLAQTGADPTDERFPILVYDGETFQDFTLTTRFKIVSGISEQMAGIVFRFQDASNFYVVRASALGQNVRFYKMVDGVRSDPIGPQLKVSIGDWHTLAVQCHGNQIVIQFDGKLVMPPLNDNTFAAGKIGFWTKSDALSYFSDPVIDYTPRIPAARELVKNIMEKQPRILGLQIYTLDDKGQPRVIASKDEDDLGKPGTDAEKDAIANGKVYYGRGDGVDAITMPFRDRNGDPMAAVHFRLKSFLGETQDNALGRATLLIHAMQAQITSSDELLR